MYFHEEVDHITGIYRCNDPIVNLKFRIRLEKVKSSFIPLQENDGGDMRLQSTEDDAEERVFSWQEKVFSPHEMTYYKRLENCDTPLEHKYHKEVIRMLKKSKRKNRLYSYTDADQFTQLQEVHQEVVVGPSKRSYLESSVSNLRLRRGPGFKKIYRGDVHLPFNKMVEEHPSNEFKSESHLLTSTPQAMYILADLSVKESDGDWLSKHEYVLCKLHYYPDGVLQISPDFTRDKSLPYQIEVDSDSRIFYHYWIEHASLSISDEDSSKKRAIIEKLTQHLLNLRQLVVGKTFEIPPPGVTVIQIMGEIASAVDFEYDSIFVYYLLDIPNGWKANDTDKLSGITQTSCSTVNHESKDVVYFGHLFEVNLIINHNEIKDESESSSSTWPQLLIRVTSVDWWGRHRTEGYGHSRLPLHPGHHHLNVQTWRPLILSPIGELRRFFVGGSPELEDLSYAGIPTSNIGPLLNRHGVRSASSGSVTVHYNVLCARNPHNADPDPLGLTDISISKEENVDTSKAKNVSMSAVFNSVDSVVSAFFKARARLQKIKEEIKEEMNTSKSDAVE